MSNPKDSVGTKKAPLSAIPACVMAEVGVGMHEGALKYGRFNWRTTAVVASVYYDATFRHLTAWIREARTWIRIPTSRTSPKLSALCSSFENAMIRQKISSMTGRQFPSHGFQHVMNAPLH